jgi:hypothetical protein
MSGGAGAPLCGDATREGRWASDAMIVSIVMTVAEEAP